MKTFRDGEPPGNDPSPERERTQRLRELRAQHDALVSRLATAKQRLRDLQAALNQLQSELNQNQPQLAPVQQNLLNLRTTADGLRPRIEELRTAYDAVTARLLGSIDCKQPALLFPLRLETRFMASSTGAHSLCIRIYPDDVHIDTHEPALTADEQQWGSYFQTQAKSGEDQQKRAWRQLTERFGIRRAAWIARVFDPAKPLSVGSRAGSWTRAPYSKVFPDRWVAMLYNNDRPVITAWSKPIQDVVATGPSPSSSNPGSSSLTAAGLPAVDDGMRWMIDFNSAVDAGLGMSLPITAEQAKRGFDRVLVLGFKSLNNADAAPRLIELFEAQHYTRGLSLLPQNAPTNNTEQSSAGEGPNNRDPEVAYAIELGNPLIGASPTAADDRLDGHWLAWALGIPASVFEHIRHADSTEQRDARRANRQLWPLDTPWLRRLLVNDNSGSVPDFVGDHFPGYVIGRGPLPALCIGSQPYGILPVTSFDRVSRRARPVAESVFLERLRSLQSVWCGHAAAAYSVTRGDDLIGLLAESGSSCNYVVQDFQNGPQPPVSMDAATLVAKLLPGSTIAPSAALETLDACSHRPDAWVTSLATRRLDELRKAVPSGIRLGCYGWVEEVRPGSTWQSVTAPAGVSGAVFQTTGNKGFLQAPSVTHAATAAILRSGYLSHLDQGQGNPFAVDLSSDRVRRAEWLLQGVRQGQPLGALLGYRFERRLHETTPPLDQYIARFRTLAGIKDDSDLAKDYADVRSKEKIYEDAQAAYQLSNDQAARAEAAAATASANLNRLRTTHDLYQAVVNAYAQLQGQLASAQQAVTDAQAALNQHTATSPVSALHTKRINKPGFQNVDIVDSADLVDEADLATWTADQASLARTLAQKRASLRDLLTKLNSGKQAADDAKSQVTRLDPLIADATRTQTTLQQAAQNADAQVKDKKTAFDKAEKALSDARLVLAQAITQQWQTSLESVAANNVVDGLELRRRYRAALQSTPPRWDATTVPFGDSTFGFPPTTDQDFNTLKAQLQWLDEIVDAVADLILAESTYHLVEGNPLRAGATLDSIAGGEAPPPELEVISTPRTGVGLAHRMVVLFSAAASFSVSSWPVDAQPPRAAAEPVLNAWAAMLLPNPAKVHCRAEFIDRQAGTVVGSADILLSELRLSPLDVVYMTHAQGAQRAELEQRLIYYLLTTKNVPATADIRLNYQRDSQLALDSFSFGELVETAQTVRKLFAGCRAIDSKDLAGTAENPDPAIKLDELSNRATAAQQAMQNALSSLQASVAALRNSPTATLDGLSKSLLQASAFGIAGAIPVLGEQNSAQARVDLIAQGDSVVKEMAARLQRIFRLTPPDASSPYSRRDYELERFQELFGADFQVVFWVTPPNTAALQQAFSGSLSLQGENPLEAVTWFSRAACVRAGMARMNSALQYGEAIGSGATLALQVAQLPYRAGDRWAALKGPVAPGLLSIVAHSPLTSAISFDQPIAGLTIDEWNEMAPKAKEVTGITFHFDQPIACAPQAMLLAVPPDDRPLWDLGTLQSVLLDTLTLTRSRAWRADGRVEVSWIDGRIPKGAHPSADVGDSWTWITHDPTPLSGQLAHASSLQAGEHQHFFSGATDTLKVGVGDSLFAYVYLDSTNPPREVMLQWRTSDGSFEHRAYWGENLINWGQDTTLSRRRMGGLPPMGQWVRLEVPAAVVGLEGQEINGAAFTLFDGRATWDRAGKVRAQPASVDSVIEHNETVWIADRPPQGATLFADSDSWQWVSRSPSPLDGSFVHQSSLSSGTHQHFFAVMKETLWIDSQLPTGASVGADGENWNWVSQNPASLRGRVAHQSALATGMHQHYFVNASSTMHVAPGDDLFAFVFLDPANPPREIMLQWRTHDGSFEHRAYWGEDLIAFGAPGTPNRCYMGPLPAPGQWVRLEVPARLVGLENTDVNGMAFALYDGRATWDQAGRSVQGTTLRVAKGDVFYAYVYLDESNPPAEIMLQWNDGNWEHRAYWAAQPSNSIQWGTEGTPSRLYIDKLPPAGQWVRLEVPAKAVGLEGREVQGMSFALFNGRATWGNAGVASAPLVPALVFATGVI